MSSLKIVDAVKDELVEFTRQLIRIRSFTGQEKDLAETILHRLNSFGCDEAWIDEVGNVVAVLYGDGAGPNLLLNGHMDVVPPGKLENWPYDPFEAVVDKDGILWGRGTADMKGGLAPLVYSMKLLKALRDQGHQLPGNVIFSAVVYEEAAECLGMEHLCATTLPAKGLSFDLCMIGEPTNGRINLGHRGKVELVVRTHGKTAHSSRPWEGINALEKMLPVLDQVFNHIAPELPTHPDLGKISITVTNLVCKPGALSIIPDECEISIDRRYLPGDTLPLIVSGFQTILDQLSLENPQFKASVQVRSIRETTYTGVKKEVQKHHPAWIMDKNNPYIQSAHQALQKIGQPVDFGYFVGGVDGSLTAGIMDIPTFGYSLADEGLAHTEHEHIALNAISANLEGYLAILCEFLGIDIQNL